MKVPQLSDITSEELVNFNQGVINYCYSLCGSFFEVVINNENVTFNDFHEAWEYAKSKASNN